MKFSVFLPIALSSPGTLFSTDWCFQVLMCLLLLTIAPQTSLVASVQCWDADGAARRQFKAFKACCCIRDRWVKTKFFEWKYANAPGGSWREGGCGPLFISLEEGGRGGRGAPSGGSAQVAGLGSDQAVHILRPRTQTSAEDVFLSLACRCCQDLFLLLLPLD